MQIRPRTCPICNNEAPHRLTKGHTLYYQCESCRTLFSDPINQEGMVGGEHEIPRNVEQNHIRIDRVAKQMVGFKKEEFNILDFGAGHGMLMKDFRDAGYNCDAYDAYNPEFSRLPEKNKYHIVTMVEIIEHTSSPFIELDVVNRSLVMGGIVTIETGFWNISVEDCIPIEDYVYIAPHCGHATIFSHHGLDLLMYIKGFMPRRHWDRNCRNFQKIK